MKQLFILLFSALLSSVVMGQGIVGDWYGALELPGVKLRLVLHVTGQDSTYRVTMDSPDQGAKGIPAGAVIYTEPVLTVLFPTLNASYRANYQQEKLKGTFTQMGQSFPLNMSREALARNRPQEPKPPYPYVCEEVVFENPKAGISLAGTLTLPKGEGSFPAVVLITGSGAQNRDEELMEHKPFWVLADYLTRRGIAVLRYDDREVGGSGGVYAQATTYDFAEDVAAAVTYLRSRKEIRPTAIGLVGHSEGGLIAPMVAAEDPEIAFAVLLAGVGLPGKELLSRQTADILKNMNTPQESIDRNVAMNNKLYTLLLTLPEAQAQKAMDSVLRKEMPMLSQCQGMTPIQLEEAIQQVLMTIVSPWFREFLRLDPTVYLKRTRCPVLALNGRKDLQVNAELNLPAIYDALHAGGNQRVDTVSLPGMNHLFQTCKTGDISEYVTIPETFSPTALQIVAEWIQKIVQAEAKR